MELGADVIISVHLLVQAAISQSVPPSSLLCSVFQVLCWVQNDRSLGGYRARGGGGNT